MRHILYLFLFALLFSGCNKQAESESAVYKSEVAAITMSAPPPPGAADDEKAIPQKIIKYASLRFETNDIEETFHKIQTAVKESHATIQSDSEGKNDNSLFRNITVRVPSQNFDVFLQSISKGVSYFDQKDISTEDVTEQYIDLDSRLKTKQKLEERYIEILKKATKISEILEIEKQISAIREEIESKQGQLKYLESRVSESRISIEFYKPIAEKQSIKISYGSKILTAIQSGFFELSGLFIWIISVWPFLILFGVIAFYIRRRFKRKKI
ncbi:MAG: DUF4349 domain-containing protein [Flavobacterium circumlabens]|uniref:DUF4349 domain-containing protein n=1 Tax=Flavobacterium circumlabens TaxID=2133765 RepID=A0A4Y7U8H7_9FLAO|nr:DUF4349 domain-containing protein [Flavobacterium circumlabens]TCN61244.1 uncharacterized protein DUF4349 [Flavobacterium circumlabens]TEB42119.1 DUF4349 domain-containing protein [Flavobacterium circumlabens]